MAERFGAESGSAPAPHIPRNVSYASGNARRRQRPLELLGENGPFRALRQTSFRPPRGNERYWPSTYDIRCGFMRRPGALLIRLKPLHCTWREEAE